MDTVQDTMHARLRALSKYAVAIALCPMLPVPLLDFFLVPVLARRMFIDILPHRRHARVFASKNDSFCLGCFLSVLLYPIVKFFKVAKFFLRLSSYVDEFQYWLYKGYITHLFLDALDGRELTDPDWNKVEAMLDETLRNKTMGRNFFSRLRQFFSRVGFMDSLRIWLHFGREGEALPGDLQAKLEEGRGADAEGSLPVSDERDEPGPFLVELVDHDREAIRLLVEKMKGAIEAPVV